MLLWAAAYQNMFLCSFVRTDTSLFHLTLSQERLSVIQLGQLTNLTYLNTTGAKAGYMSGGKYSVDQGFGGNVVQGRTHSEQNRSMFDPQKKIHWRLFLKHESSLLISHITTYLISCIYVNDLGEGISANQTLDTDI